MTAAVTLPLADALPAGLPEDPYEAYSYSYPHKSAYGPLEPSIPLVPLWQAEDRSALFLYLHVPFCEMRCGFCNLFARAGANDELINAYLDTLDRQARVLAEITGTNCGIARLAVGGGTPTFLNAAQLDRLLGIAHRHFNAEPSHIPTSVETSPKTATHERLRVLRDYGVQRVSIGVQSFLEEETHAIGRPQAPREVHAALERLREFPVLNIDLIYGQPGQSVTSWLTSLRCALRYQPEEIYLYPLYVRPNTGLGRRGDGARAPAGLTRLLYREARGLLAAEGYEQVSMRFFQDGNAPPVAGPTYCCQTDGMIGLGCGARSYSSRVHYSSRFAVEPAQVQSLINHWIGRTAADFAVADWGVRMTDEDRKRRFVIQSLLTRAGLVEGDYQRRFLDPAEMTFPHLQRLVDEGLAQRSAGVWRLTALGFELSDAIGPSLYSPEHRARLRAFASA